MIAKLWNSLFSQPAQGSTDVTVLVVDDSPVDLALVERTLAQKGYRVITATEARVGIELAQRHKPDIVILDYRMPELSGSQVCEILKTNENTKNIPVIFLTSSDTSETLVESYDKGADNFLTKPVQPRELLRSIATILKDQIVKGSS